MSDPGASLLDAERRLQAAQLAGDVAALDALLRDALVATLTPDPAVVTKAEDLESHRARRLALASSEQEDLVVRVAGDTGLTRVVLALTGTLDGEPFAVRMLYTRTWHHDAAAGWRVLGAHITPLG